MTNAAILAASVIGILLMAPSTEREDKVQAHTMNAPSGATHLVSFINEFRTTTIVDEPADTTRPFRHMWDEAKQEMRTSARSKFMEEQDHGYLERENAYPSGFT